jgi:hypothetical protein
MPDAPTASRAGGPILRATTDEVLNLEVLSSHDAHARCVVQVLVPNVQGPCGGGLCRRLCHEEGATGGGEEGLEEGGS